MIFTQEKNENYFAETNFTDEKSVGSSDTNALFMVDKEGKDLHTMIKSFNRQLKKANVYDIDAALIPSPVKFTSPDRNLLNSDNKKSPSTARAPNQRRGSFTLTPVNTEFERRKSVAVPSSEISINHLIVNNNTALANIAQDLDKDKYYSNKIQSTPNFDKRVKLKIPADGLNTSIGRILPPKPTFIPNKLKNEALKHQPRKKAQLNTSVNRSMDASAEFSISSKNHSTKFKIRGNDGRKDSKTLKSMTDVNKSNGESFSQKNGEKSKIHNKASFSAQNQPAQQNSASIRSALTKNLKSQNSGLTEQKRNAAEIPHKDRSLNLALIAEQTEEVNNILDTIQKPSTQLNKQSTNSVKEATDVVPDYSAKYKKPTISTLTFNQALI